jgi:hypothetical protein
MDCAASNQRQPSQHTVANLVSQLGGRPQAIPMIFSAASMRSHEPLLSTTARRALIERLDTAAAAKRDALNNTGPSPNTGAAEINSSDLKLDLCKAELQLLVGKAAAARIGALFGGRYNQIKLRRTASAAGQCIAFHLDHSIRTMQVPLNDPREYDGGRVIFALANGSLLRPEREVGGATLHNNGVVHGVTEITRGVRYGLFFLLVPEDC